MRGGGRRDDRGYGGGGGGGMNYQQPGKSAKLQNETNKNANAYFCLAQVIIGEMMGPTLGVVEAMAIMQGITMVSSHHLFTNSMLHLPSSPSFELTAKTKEISADNYGGGGGYDRRDNHGGGGGGGYNNRDNYGKRGGCGLMADVTHFRRAKSFMSKNSLSRAPVSKQNWITLRSCTF